GAKRAAQNASGFRPFTMEPPYLLEMRFLNSGNADGAAVMPGVKRTGGTTVTFESNDVLEMFRGLQAIVDLSSGAAPHVRPK
ncbi:MAG: M55 family metallopeptidase, partial [Planctomycetota bacterium]